MECPINKGKLEITKTVELPREIPPVSAIQITVGNFCLADLFS
jgi:hypothetical protein